MKQKFDPNAVITADSIEGMTPEQTAAFVNKVLEHYRETDRGIRRRMALQGMLMLLTIGLAVGVSIALPGALWLNHSLEGIHAELRGINAAVQADTVKRKIIDALLDPTGSKENPR